MSALPRARLLLVGEELLQGRKGDRNGAGLARRLVEEGFAVEGLSVVADDERAIARAVRAAATAADVVVVSGGLGPTEDDRTREGLARAAGVALETPPDATAALRAALEARGLDPDAPGRERQARVPAGGRWLANAEGTALGLRVMVGDAAVFALPGVPRELRAMFEAEVVPWLAAQPGRAPLVGDGLYTAARPESEVARLLDGIAPAGEVALGLYPHDGEVEARFHARGAGAAEAVAAAVAEARRRLGDDAYAPGPIERHVVDSLQQARASLVTAESMTGGLVARMLTDVPGSSEVFAGGWVTYSDAWKRDALGVDAALLAKEGAVSASVARAMAEGARRRSGADLAVAVTGIAGPDDGQAPDGTRVAAGTFHVAVAGAAGTQAAERRLALPRAAVRRRAAVLALDLVRRAVGALLE